MNEVNETARQNRQLIAEAERIRLRLQEALEELEEIRDQAQRQRREVHQRRITAADPDSRQNAPARNRDR